MLPRMRYAACGAWALYDNQRRSVMGYQRAPRLRPSGDTGAIAARTTGSRHRLKLICFCSAGLS